MIVGGSPQMKLLAKPVRYSSRGETIARVPKLVLDVLPGPATMTSRQHSGTKLSIRRGKPARRRRHQCCAGGCQYGSMVHALAAMPALR